MNRYFQFNSTQLNQTDTFEAQDQPNAQLGLWFMLVISMLFAGCIIRVWESWKGNSNEVNPEGGRAESQAVMYDSGATEDSEDNTNPDDYNVDRFFSVLSENKLNQINPLFIVLTRYSYLDTL